MLKISHGFLNGFNLAHRFQIIQTNHHGLPVAVTISTYLLTYLNNELITARYFQCGRPIKRPRLACSGHLLCFFLPFLDVKRP